MKPMSSVILSLLTVVSLGNGLYAGMTQVQVGASLNDLIGKEHVQSIAKKLQRNRITTARIDDIKAYLQENNLDTLKFINDDTEFYLLGAVQAALDGLEVLAPVVTEPIRVAPSMSAERTPSTADLGDVRRAVDLISAASSKSSSSSKAPSRGPVASRKSPSKSRRMPSAGRVI